MTKNIKSLLFWIAMCVLAVLFLASKFGVPAYIESSYQSGELTLLNELTDNTAPQPVEFYLGVIEEDYSGPLTYFFSGLLLIALGLKYLTRVNGVIFALAMIVYFMVVKWEVLFFPLYGDTVSGPLAEAIWLLNHGFDYVGLSQEPTYDAGGPKIYLFSLYPTLQALFLKFIPSTTWYLVINHFLTFIMAAISISAYRGIVRKIFDERISFLLSIIFLSFPIFQSQVEAVNMEFPLVVFSILAMYYLAHKKFMLATIMAIIASAFKGVGILVCGTIFVVCLFLFFFNEDEKFSKRALWAMALNLVFVGVLLFANLTFLGSDGNIPMVGIFQGWKENKRLPVWWLCAASLIIFIGCFLKEKWNKDVDSFIGFLNKHYVVSIMYGFVIAYFILYINSFGAQYRYRLLLAPFSLFIIYYVVQRLIRSKIFHQWLLTILAAFSFFCAYGFIFPDQEFLSHSAYERTLEYRNDLKLQMKVAKVVESEFKHLKIGAPFTVAQTYAFPQMGYVSDRLDVMLYSYPCTYGDIENFRGLENLNIGRTIWVGYKTMLSYHMHQVVPYYPYGPEDKVIRNIIYGNRSAQLFLGGVYIDRFLKIRLLIYQQYLAQQAKQSL